MLFRSARLITNSAVQGRIVLRNQKRLHSTHFDEAAFKRRMNLGTLPTIAWLTLMAFFFTDGFNFHKEEVVEVTQPIPVRKTAAAAPAAHHH